MVLAQEAEGREVLTAEGLVSRDGKLHPVQQAFIEEGAIQCGFCTPGMVLAVYDLLKRNPNPTDEEMKVALSGNLCRCTGYEGIFRAVRKAAKLMSAGA
jgi:carbon-monoxide dehydrogenase small subunit